MPRDEQTIGRCPVCGSDSLNCKYNLFESDNLRIDSWEHRCSDCGHRETTAFRSDDLNDDVKSTDAENCPYCGRKVET